jgi:hypothetical protein
VAEYLMFIASSGTTSTEEEMSQQDENIYLTQKKIAAIFDVREQDITQLIQQIYESQEFSQDSAVKKSSADKSDSQESYNLDMVIAIGLRANSPRAVRFRKWAGQVMKDSIIQGWAMDTERFKNGHPFSNRFYMYQLQSIQEIRLSERKFYQKVTDIYATAFDYDKDAQITISFNQLVLGKLIFAAGRTKVENRGQSVGESKTDVSRIQNYLSEPEMDYLERIVSLYLEYGQRQAERKIPLSMEDWANRLDGFMEFDGDEMRISEDQIRHQQIKLFAKTEFETNQSI